MREKLIELLETISHPQRLYPDLYVDHLIANDVVPVVRCKDCRWRKGKLCYMISGCPEPVGTGDDFFCSYGERKDNG